MVQEKASIKVQENEKVLRAVTLPGGKAGLDFLDYLTANYFLTIAAFITSLFVGWKLDKNIIKNQLTNEGSINAGYMGIFYFILKFIAPIAIIIVFLAGIGLI